MKNYLVLDFSEMKLNNWAVLLGRKNIKAVQTPVLDFSVFKCDWKDKCLWFIYSSQWNKTLTMEDVSGIFYHFPEFEPFEKIVGLPNSYNVEDGSLIEKLEQQFSNVTLYIQLAFAGDPQTIIYPNQKKLKVVSSGPFNERYVTEDGETKLRCTQTYENISDYKLALCWFWLVNHLSLINRTLLEKMISSIQPENKVFILGRRITDGAGYSTADSRKFYTSVLQKIVSEEKYKLHSLLNPHIDFSGFARNGTSTALLLDYNSCYFNLIFESWAPHVDLTDTFTEKTASYCAFSGPSFLIANPHLISMLESIGIKPLNSFFTGDTLEEQLRNFCDFYQYSTEEEIKLFYNQQVEIQKNNREIFWNYAENSKDSILELIFQENE